LTVNSKFGIVAKNTLQLNIDTIEEILDMPVMGEEIGEPKVSAEADNESHCVKLHGEPFCVTENDLDLIDIDGLF